MVAELANEGLGSREIGGLGSERCRDFGLDGTFALAHRVGQALHGFAIAGASCFGERLTSFHHFHEERRIGTGRLGLVRVPPVTSQERSSAADGVAKDPKRVVHFDGAAERLLAFPSGSPRVAIGMQDATQIAMALLDELHVEVETSFEL